MNKTPHKLSIADIVGPWLDSEFESGLISRCKHAWHKPIEDLTNEEIATFLRQRIATTHILPIAEHRVSTGFDDDTEMFDGELREVVENVKTKLGDSK